MRNPREEAGGQDTSYTGGNFGVKATSSYGIGVYGSTAATEQLFGVSQFGTSDEEDAQLRSVLQHPKVAAAIEFCRWAIDFLRSRPTPTEADLSLVSSRASALAP